MNRNQHSDPFPGPIPVGVMRVSADIPMEMWEEMRRASRRRGVEVGDLIVAAQCTLQCTSLP
jgi:hypothetical protein